MEAPPAAPESEPSLGSSTPPEASPDATATTKRAAKAPDGGSESLLVMCEFINALLRVADATFGESCVLDPHCSLLTIHFSLLTTQLLTTHCSVLSTHCLLLTTKLLTTHYSLLTTHY